MSVAQLYNELETRFRATRPNEDPAPLREAFVFAAEHHQGQVRDSGEPFVAHPLHVTLILADMNLDLVCLQTGLLHDVIEDTAAALDAYA